MWEPFNPFTFDVAINTLMSNSFCEYKRSSLPLSLSLSLSLSRSLALFFSVVFLFVLNSLCAVFFAVIRYSLSLYLTNQISFFSATSFTLPHFLSLIKVSSCCCFFLSLFHRACHNVSYSLSIFISSSLFTHSVAILLVCVHCACI